MVQVTQKSRKEKKENVKPTTYQEGGASSSTTPVKKPQAALTNAKQTRSSTPIPKTTYRKENVIKIKGIIEKYWS